MTTTNREILERLFREGGINLVRGAIFDRVPPPLPAEFDFSKVEGMMLGLAIGDALGNTSEGQLPSVRRERHGEIRDYLPNWYADNRPVGLPSDDTQMAFWTLEQMLEDGRLDPARLAERFTRGQIFGIGGTVKQFLRNYKSGLPWEQCGAASAGNGALMRIAPVLIPHLKSPTPELWADAALAAMLTHNDAGSTAACVAFVSMLWELLAMTAPPPPEWWLDAYVRTASELEGDTRYEPRSEAVEYYQGPIWRFVQQRVGEAFQRDASVLDAGNSWYSGAYLLETVPTVIYILMRHGHDPEEAIVRAVNDTKDNDTVAAIVGAAVGALHGRSGLPARWIENLLGRTTDCDDGRVFELLEAARGKWWSTP
jgi:ADP-ribosyl-[dinitrogen reductase] hydrolase